MVQTTIHTFLLGLVNVVVVVMVNVVVVCGGGERDGG
jgi:hypothetical protein